MANRPAASSGAAYGAKISEFPLVEGFVHGYRNREDVTTLPPGILVVGSQNVLTNTFQRVGIVKGYTLDGQRDTSGNPILSGYDWQRHTGDEQHLRAGFAVLTSLGKLQYRYVASAGDVWNGHTFTEGEVYWIDLMTALGNGTDDTAVRFRFTEFWDFDHELKSMLLFVNSTSNIFMWTGAVGTVAATSWATGSVSVLNATPTAAGTGYAVGDTFTITTGGTLATGLVASIGALGAVTGVTLTAPGSGYTTGAGKATTTSGAGAGLTVNITTVAQGFVKLNGTTTAAALGFLNTATYTQQVSINTTAYTYAQAVGVYLVGLSADPTGNAAQSVAHQAVVTTANSSMTGVPATFKNYIIQALNNQVYLSASDNNSVYVSNVNSFTDYSFASPRAVGEGAILTLDGVPTAIVAQETEMYISAGRDFWYQTKFQLAADNTAESLTVTRLKTTPRQAAQSQEAVSKIKNNIFYVSGEPIVNALGTAKDYLNDPQAQDYSFPIVNDMNAYDFDDCSAFFNQKYGYVCVPKEGLMRIYNMTDDGRMDPKTGMLTKNHYWEAPLVGYSMKCLAVIGGDLYGHSYQSSNTYKLFDGYEFDGNVYEAVAAFSFEDSGVRHMRKSSTAAFVEGYITSNTTLTMELQREVTGGSTAEFTILGSDTSIVQQGADVASLGKDSLGKHSLGGEDEFTDQFSNPPKFRVYKTYNPTPYFEQQTRFSSIGKNQVWEIVSFGSSAKVTTELPTDIYQ